jgi:hypothetical protein
MHVGESWVSAIAYNDRMSFSFSEFDGVFMPFFSFVYMIEITANIRRPAGPWIDIYQEKTLI